MRINANAHPHAKYMLVYLNGNDVSAECVEADDELGYVELIDRDENGDIQWIECVNNSYSPKLRRERGDVEIKPMMSWHI